MTQRLSSDTLQRIQGHIANLANPDVLVSQSAEVRLIRFGAKAIPLLIEATRSNDPQVRFRAVWALGKTKDCQALDTILGLIHDQDERVAYDSILALGELGDVRAVEELLRIASSYSSEDGRFSASVTALAKLGHTISIDTAL